MNNNNATAEQSKLCFERDDEYERKLYEQDMEQYSMSFEEWITQMEENADRLEKEYYEKSQKESIERFKEKYPNGAVIDIEAMTDKELNMDSSFEEIWNLVDYLTDGVEVDLDDSSFNINIINLSEEGQGKLIEILLSNTEPTEEMKKLRSMDKLKVRGEDNE